MLQQDYYWTQTGHYGTSRLTVHQRARPPSDGDDVIVPLGRDVTIGPPPPSSGRLRRPRPVYWKLPAKFGGDRVLSYNGYLRFTLSSTQWVGV